MFYEVITLAKTTIIHPFSELHILLTTLVYKFGITLNNLKRDIESQGKSSETNNLQPDFNQTLI